MFKCSQFTDISLQEFWVIDQTSRNLSQLQQFHRHHDSDFLSHLWGHRIHENTIWKNNRHRLVSSSSHINSLPDVTQTRPERQALQCSCAEGCSPSESTCHRLQWEVWQHDLRLLHTKSAKMHEQIRTTWRTWRVIYSLTAILKMCWSILCV